MALTARPKQNQLLAALPEPDWQRWLPHLELVELPLGKVLYEAGDTLSHAYFPTDSIISLLYVMRSGESAEIAVVGYEGVVGISLFMGGDSTSSRGGGAKRRVLLPDARSGSEGRIQHGRAGAAFTAALYASIDHSDDSNRSVQ